MTGKACWAARMNYARIPISKKPRRPAGDDPVERRRNPRKLRGIMVAQALSPVRHWLMTALTRPLKLQEVLALGAALIVAGTIYCQIYCLLALQRMHGASMPLAASLWRGNADVLPAFLVFESGKRALGLPRVRRWLAIGAIFVGGIALGVLIRSQVHIMSAGLTPRHMAVDRIPFMLLAAAALTYYWLRSAHGANSDPWAAGDERDRIPPAKAIDWVKAAGNYVEIRVAGRTRLLRMTLRQARALLPGEQFIQIHRSVIVNRERIAAVKGRRSVEMADGTSFTVGDAHRSNLPEL
jgi:hypothetical protein